MTGALEEVFLALERITQRAKEGETIDVHSELRGVPVPARALLAGLALASAGRPVTGAALARSAGYSRGTALAKHGELLALIVAAATSLSDGLLELASDSPSVPRLAEELRKRDSTIAALRSELAASAEDRDAALAYARDLHQHVQREFDVIQAERDQKVRHLRPLD